jgi:hypothetical protein
VAYYPARLGHPDKPSQQITFGSPMSRDGEGSRALVDLLASYVTSQPADGGQAREILLAVDEFSAVSRRLPIWQLYRHTPVGQALSPL